MTCGSTLCWWRRPNRREKRVSDSLDLASGIIFPRSFLITFPLNFVCTSTIAIFDQISFEVIVLGYLKGLRLLSQGPMHVPFGPRGAEEVTASTALLKLPYALASRLRKLCEFLMLTQCMVTFKDGRIVVNYFTGLESERWDLKMVKFCVICG